MTDQAEPGGDDFDPLHGIPREELDRAHEIAEGPLEEACRAIGLHLQGADLGVVPGLDGAPRVAIIGHFLIGDLAWSDRVQNPQAEADADTVGAAETEIMRDRIRSLRDKMARKPEDEADGSP